MLSGFELYPRWVPLPDTNSHKFVLTAARFWSQRWLAVGINGSWKRLLFEWLFSRMISRRRSEGSIFLSFLLFHGLIVRKYALIRAMEILKFRWLFISYIFSGFALFTELMWVYRRVTMCLLIYQQKNANQSTVHLKSGFIWKCSREWLFSTGYASGRSLQKKPQSPTVKY